LGGLFLLILIIMAVYVALILPRSRAARESEIARINTANTATAAVLTKVAVSARLTLDAPTATPLPTNTSVPTATKPAPTSTNVVAQPSSTSTQGIAAPVDTRTATVAALLTQAAQARLTSTYLPTATGLPKTGFAEDVGIPGLAIAALLLVAVIFMVRRMRISSVS
jgi:hypothetical protein